MPSNQDPFGASTLVDGGVAGALIRAKDWSANPIGPVETWPGALKALVRVMLSTKQATCLFWGPALINLYNDGYIPLLGEKHPRAMGQRAQDCWSDAWPVVGGLLADVVEKGAAVLFQEMLVPIVRGGRLEDAWWNFSYSPAFDDGGAIAGILVVATEMTGEVAGRRQLETASRTKDEFLAMLGHELRNPLAPMQTALQPDAARGVAGRKELAIIERQVGTLVRLVDDLLDVARITGGKVELRKAAPRAGAGGPARAGDRQPAAGAAQASDRVCRCPRRPARRRRPDRLAQMVSNLLTNAAQVQRGRRAAIRVTAVRAVGQVAAAVATTAIGIPADMLAQRLRPVRAAAAAAGPGQGRPGPGPDHRAAAWSSSTAAGQRQQRRPRQGQRVRRRAPLAARSAPGHGRSAAIRQRARAAAPPDRARSCGR